MKRRALSWFMAAALGVGTMAGGIGSANIVLAEEQNEETEAADETSEEPADETDTDSSVMKIGALKGPTAMGMAPRSSTIGTMETKKIIRYFISMF